jgi:hypothetical protein
MPCVGKVGENNCGLSGSLERPPLLPICTRPSEGRALVDLSVCVQRQRPPIAGSGRPSAPRSRLIDALQPTGFVEALDQSGDSLQQGSGADPGSGLAKHPRRRRQAKRRQRCGQRSFDPGDRAGRAQCTAAMQVGPPSIELAPAGMGVGCAIRQHRTRTPTWCRALRASDCQIPGSTPKLAT